MLKNKSNLAWKNWAGNQTSNPLGFENPRNEEDLSSIVKNAKQRNLRVKVIGTGHSFTGIAVPDQLLVTLDSISSLHDVDLENLQVRVGAGIKICDLNSTLQRFGLAMPNLGDIAYQTLSGAISTSTHGTGLGFKTIADAVISMRVIDGNGNIISCDKDINSELFHTARIGLGALGIITEVTLQCVPKFNLHAVEEILPLGRVTNEFDRLAELNDHVEFFWMPNTDKALLKRNTRTSESPPLPRNKRHALRRKWNRFKNKEIKENLLFGTLNHIGNFIPPLVPKFNELIAGDSGRAEYVTKSYEVFTSPRRVRFYEMEYAVPKSSGIEAFKRVVTLIENLDQQVSFPVEYRVLGGDNIPLSTTVDQESAYVAVHVFRGTKFEKYFRGVEDIMSDYGGRPHWGKLHFKNHKDLSRLYPQWELFQIQREAMDPYGRFTNSYLNDVLGPMG